MTMEDHKLEQKADMMRPGKDCTVTVEEGKDGRVIKRIYPVLPGISLVYNDVSMQLMEETMSEEDRQRNIYEINHCAKGRVESSTGGHFYYLTAGDISIHKKQPDVHTAYFPTKEYQGASIVIDLEQAPKCFSCLLNDVDVKPEHLMEKFCGNGEVFIARSNQHLEHVFSELYHIPEAVIKGYQKIKILEIFLFLSCMPVDQEEERKGYSASQVALAKRVCNFLTSHIGERITISDLAEVFHVSQTQLKNCFKGVYGGSIYAYIRKIKMEHAADMLSETDKTVLEIANLHGYDNASKFAKAFGDVMGTTPTEYRKNHMTKEI